MTIKISVYQGQRTSGWSQSKSKSIVRATDEETGLFAESSDLRSDHANRAKAIERLERMLKTAKPMYYI